MTDHDVIAGIQLTQFINGGLRRIALFNQPAKPTRVDSKSTTPIARGPRFTVNGGFQGVPPVVCLLKRSRPSAILRRVVAVYVDSVDRVLGRWPRPHVGKKRREVVPPSIAHCYTASAVTLVAVMCAPVATSPSRHPHFVLGRLVVVPSMSMSYRPRDQKVIAQTTATSRGSGLQVAALKIIVVAAVAQAPPKNTTATGGVLTERFNSHQSPEALSTQIKCAHGVNDTIFGRVCEGKAA